MPSSAEEQFTGDSQCIVCLKEVRDGDALCRFTFEERTLTLCCPLCMEAFKATPKTYLGRMLPPRTDATSF